MKTKPIALACSMAMFSGLLILAPSRGQADSANGVNTSSRLSRGGGVATDPGSMLAAQSPMVQFYANLPLSFEANQGQTDARAKFVSHGSGYTLFLTTNEAVFALREPS